MAFASGSVVRVGRFDRGGKGGFAESSGEDATEDVTEESEG